MQENPRINDWLRLVENEMRSTLAVLLNRSLDEFSKLEISCEEPQKFMEWLDNYPVMKGFLSIFIFNFLIAKLSVELRCQADDENAS